MLLYCALESADSPGGMTLGLPPAESGGPQQPFLPNPETVSDHLVEMVMLEQLPCQERKMICHTISVVPLDLTLLLSSWAPDGIQAGCSEKSDGESLSGTVQI